MCCFRKKSRACDKLLMELCFVSSSQRTNEQCREPLAARSYWTHARGLHGELAGWDSATAGATCFLGSCSLPVRTPSPVRAAVSHGVTFPHGPPDLRHPDVPFHSTPLWHQHPCLLPGPPSLLPLRGGGVGRSSHTQLECYCWYEDKHRTLGP